MKRLFLVLFFILFAGLARAQFRHQVGMTYENAFQTNSSRVSLMYQYRLGSRGRNAIAGGIKHVFTPVPYSGFLCSYLHTFLRKPFPGKVRCQNFVLMNTRISATYFPVTWDDEAIQDNQFHVTLQPCIQLIRKRRYGIEISYGITLNQDAQWLQTAGVGMFYSFQGKSTGGCGYSWLFKKPRRWENN